MTNASFKIQSTPRAADTKYSAAPALALATPLAYQTQTLKIASDMVLIGIIMALLQVLDGVFTGIGIHHFGTEMEGNALIRSLMEMWGAPAALVVVKSVALVVVFTLCAIAHRVRWLPNALRAMSVTYMLAAILPWTYIICTKILV